MVLGQARRGQDPKDLYHQVREAEIGIWNVLNPRHLSKGRDETSKLEESSPAEEALGERVKVLRSSSGEPRERSPHESMRPLNLWTWGRRSGLFHSMNESTVQCGVERVRSLQRKSPLGMGWMECPPPLCRMSHLR